MNKWYSSSSYSILRLISLSEGYLRHSRLSLSNSFFLSHIHNFLIFIIFSVGVHKVSFSLRQHYWYLCVDIICLAGSGVRQQHFLHWNSSNPIFRIDNTDHIIDVNKGNRAWEHDQVNLICPVYGPGTEDAERYVIYAVSKEGTQLLAILSSAFRYLLCKFLPG